MLLFLGEKKDAFVLCRIFQKSGLGPPNGDRYAPFVEEEWNHDADADVDAALFVPEDETCVERNEIVEVCVCVCLRNCPLFLQKVIFIATSEQACYTSLRCTNDLESKRLKFENYYKRKRTCIIRTRKITRQLSPHHPDVGTLCEM